jgi:hypothetical protein
MSLICIFHRAYSIQSNTELIKRIAELLLHRHIKNVIVDSDQGKQLAQFAIRNNQTAMDRIWTRGIEMNSDGWRNWEEEEQKRLFDFNEGRRKFFQSIYPIVRKQFPKVDRATGELEDYYIGLVCGYDAPYFKVNRIYHHHFKNHIHIILLYIRTYL